MAANGMKVALHRQVSGGSMKHNAELRRQASLESPRTGRATSRFLFGRQSSMDPNRRRGRSQSPVGSSAEELTVPGNLDATMQLLFFACHGDAMGVEGLLRSGVDVNSINLDGRTALHIAACEGNRDVVRVLLNWKANIDARDRWGSTVSPRRLTGGDLPRSTIKLPFSIDLAADGGLMISFASLIIGSC
jgi:hypothetical protein